MKSQMNSKQNDFGKLIKFSLSWAAFGLLVTGFVLSTACSHAPIDPMAGAVDSPDTIVGSSDTFVTPEPESTPMPETVPLQEPVDKKALSQKSSKKHRSHQFAQRSTKKILAKKSLAKKMKSAQKPLAVGRVQTVKQKTQPLISESQFDQTLSSSNDLQSLALGQVGAAAPAIIEGSELVGDSGSEKQMPWLPLGLSVAALVVMFSYVLTKRRRGKHRLLYTT